MGLKKYCGLAIDDNRYASNGTMLFACECVVVFTIPSAVTLLLLFCALSDLKAQAEDMRSQSYWDDSLRCSHHLLHIFFQKVVAH